MDELPVPPEGVETSMEQLQTIRSPHPQSAVAPVGACTHGRVTYEILTSREKRTGQVRCLDCDAIFDDPCYQDERAHLPISVP